MKNFRFTPDKQEAFLALVRMGTRPIAAARAIKVHPDTVKRFARSNPEFADSIESAHHEAAEPIEEVVYRAAMDGEPWAAKAWLEAWNPAQWGAKPTQVKVSGEISHIIGDLGPADAILELQGRALGREADLALGAGDPDSDSDSEIVDAEIIDDDDDG
jgi:hypothetical protein